MYTYAGCAEWHFIHWYSWARRSRLEPIKAKARIIKVISLICWPIFNTPSVTLLLRDWTQKYKQWNRMPGVIVHSTGSEIAYYFTAARPTDGSIGLHTDLRRTPRWNNRPCSAAHSLIFLVLWFDEWKWLVSPTLIQQCSWLALVFLMLGWPAN